MIVIVVVAVAIAAVVVYGLDVWALRGWRERVNRGQGPPPRDREAAAGEEEDGPL